MTGFTLTRLSRVNPSDILSHMTDPRLVEHLPLLTGAWDTAAVDRFVKSKEEYWTRDGLGHWAIMKDRHYLGWGGFQKEGDEWDYGLVLKPESFGLGARITQQAFKFAVSDPRIPFVTFLLPLSRKNLSALARMGAKFVGEVDYDGVTFRKYRMKTE